MCVHSVVCVYIVCVLCCEVLGVGCGYIVCVLVLGVCT